MNVSANELAQLLGVSPKTISQWSASGVVKRVAHGKYDLKASIAGFVAHRVAVACARGPADSTTSVAAERARLLRLQGDKVQREAEREAGEWLRLADVEQGWRVIAREVRSALLALPARLAGRGALTREGAVLADDEIRDALTVLATGAPTIAGEIEAALAKPRAELA